LPTASIFSLAWVVPTAGRVTVSLPSLGVVALSTCGKVRPPSVDRLIRTSGASPAASVPLTSQVTASAVPAFTGSPAVAREVTWKGPADVSTLSVTSS
jgi:hypothetical protein